MSEFYISAFHTTPLRNANLYEYLIVVIYIASGVNVEKKYRDSYD